MADHLLFPEAALAILRDVQYNPDAMMKYDGMSDSLYWSDEFPDEATSACMAVKSWAYRFVLAYRASLIMSRPREELQPVWEQLAQECPEWPGFRPERRSIDLKPELEARSARFSADLDQLESSFNTE